MISLPPSRLWLTYVSAYINMVLRNIAPGQHRARRRRAKVDGDDGAKDELLPSSTRCARSVTIHPIVRTDTLPRRATGEARRRKQ